MALRHVEDGWMAVVMHRTQRMTESPYIARVERRLSPIVKMWQSDYALITVIDRKAHPNYIVAYIITALEKSRYVENRRKPFPWRDIITKRCRWDCKTLKWTLKKALQYLRSFNDDNIELVQNCYTLECFFGKKVSLVYLFLTLYLDF